MNGDLRVAYRASAEGARDIVFVSNWFTNCEAAPELSMAEPRVYIICTMWADQDASFARRRGLRPGHTFSP
jgi:hypothetical protein